jgi:hypothetical protein
MLGEKIAQFKEKSIGKQLPSKKSKNICIKPFLKSKYTYNKPRFETAYLGEKAKK